MTRLIAPRRLLLSFAFVTTTLLQAQQPGEPEREWVRETRYQPSPLRLAGEFPGSALSRPGHTADWPAITYGVDDALYCAYVEWDGKQADRVVARIHKPHIGPSDPIEVSGWGDHYSPAIAATPDGALVVWSRQVDGNFELFSRTLSPEGELSVPYRLTRLPHSDFNVKTVSDGAGNVIIAWQSFRNGNSDIYARRFNGDAWGPEVRISTSDANDWQPAVALDSSGTAWVSWDSYHHGNYDVFLRSFNGTRPGEVIPITTETAAQFHSSVALDANDRVWVAWDEGGENWGKDFSRSSAVDGSRGLYNSRSLGLRVWANGRLQQPSADFSEILSGGMTRYAALPHLAFDGNGALWLVFRHWTLSEPVTAHQFFATHLSGGKWSLPYRLPKSSGRATQFASLARTPMGRITVAYAGDGRSADNVPTEQLHALHYRAYATDLPKTNQPVAAQLTEVTLPRPAKRPPPRPRHAMTLAGKTYRLMWGDCHRHTDIEPHTGPDGSILDTYRYAMDAAQMDFVGTADHTETLNGRRADGLRDYQWWWTQKAVDLMTHAPVFVGIYSYEHSLQRPGGHRNLLFLKRGAPMRLIDRERRPEDNLPPNLWKWIEGNVLTQPGQKVVVVPHTFGSALADWNWPNPAYDSVLEIYQAFRGSYEAWRLPDDEKRGPTQTDEPGHFARDALDKGNVYGFVSFSDHFSTHNSWAAVWAETEDRQGVLDGMLARHSYGASDEIIVRASAGGHMPGTRFEASAARPPQIEAQIEAPDEILRIDVVKNGKYVYTTRPGKRTAKVSYRDLDAAVGETYYYLRVFQRDPENPTGDPEAAWISPFFVTYKE